MSKDFCILIVEDQEDNLELLYEFLQHQNYKTVEAKNGLEAIEIVKNNDSIDLVLMDIKMPVMDGCEALIEIRKIKPNLKVLAQTAYAMEGDRDMYIKKGFDDYISKPFDLIALKELMKKYSQD